MTVQINDRNNIPRILEQAQMLQRMSVRVGVFGDENSEQAKIAGVHEFGATIKRSGTRKDGTSFSFTITIPERSFFRSAFDEHEDDIMDLAERYVVPVLQGRLSARQFYGIIGQQMVSYIQDQLVELRDPPNARSTVKRKRSDNPLIDEGNLVQSITYEVVGG